MTIRYVSIVRRVRLDVSRRYLTDASTATTTIRDLNSSVGCLYVVGDVLRYPVG
jgi:hypothetical protein